MNTAWYLHPTSCDLGSRTRPSSKFLRVRGGSRGGTLNGGRLPETSNCFCHPGKAGGLPLCAKGLDQCRHFGPSIIDHQTLQKSGPLPPVFLRGVGLPDNLI